MSNPWLAHVKKTQEANNGMTYKEAMVKAKSTYKAPATGGAKKTPATAKKTPPRAPTPPPMPVKKPVGRPRKHTESKSSVASQLNLPPVEPRKPQPQPRKHRLVHLLHLQCQ